MAKKAKTVSRKPAVKKTTEVIRDAASKVVSAILPELDTKEKCLRCGSAKFSVSKDILNTRYCSCGNIWKPKTSEQILMDELKAERIGFKARASELKAEVDFLLGLAIDGVLDEDILEVKLNEIRSGLEGLL